MTDKFIAKVIEDEGQLCVIFTEELMTKLNLQAGEILQWEFLNDNKILISRIQTSTNNQ